MIIFPPDGWRLGLYYIGHASWLLMNADGLILLIDPFLSESFKWNDKVVWRRIPPSADVDEIASCEGILITHEHEDHYDKNTVLKIVKNTGSKVICPYGIRNIISRDGVPKKNVIGLRDKETTNLGGFNITLIAEDKTCTRACFFIKYLDIRIFHSGDTHKLPESAKREGKVDIALTWLECAEEVIKYLKPTRTILMHYNVVDEPTISGSDVNIYDVLKRLREVAPKGVKVELLGLGKWVLF